MSEVVAAAAKDRFTYLDTLAVVREIRGHIRVRVDKAFDLPDGGWSLVLRGPGSGRQELVLFPGSYAALVPAPVEHSENLTPIARELRRLISGALLSEVADPGGERAIELELQRGEGEGPIRLVLELFNPGNLLLVRDGTILAVAHPRTWAHRTVRVGAEYVLPPARGNPWTREVSEFEAELRRSRTDRATTIASRLSFGGPIAEELLARASVEGVEPATVAPEETARKLHSSVASLLADIGNPPKGFLYSSKESFVDVTPYPSQRWHSVEGVVERELPTFSEAARIYFPSVRPPPPVVLGERERRLGELKRQHDQQQTAIKTLDAEARSLLANADTIFSHYLEAEARLGELRRSEEEGSPIFEVELGDRVVPLKRNASVRESAQDLYESAKRVQAKLAGARTALTETEERIRETELERPAAPRVGSSSGVVGSERRTHWFERYRWFLSSEGAVVVGGKDASSNDLLVRRYLRAGDRYVHADIHGASSVIVKHPPPGRPSLSDTTLKEAGQWGVAFSKAWRAGLASASAFWVENDQVSKSGASGEFVAKGAWVVHGTKHVMKDLPLELAIGTEDYEGEALWTVAPPSAIRSRGMVRFLLTPGPERDRGEREKELARELGISRTRLQGMLPAGGLSIRLP